MSLGPDQPKQNQADCIKGIEGRPPVFEETLEFLLISSFNVANLATLLSKDQEAPRIQARAAPYGQVMQLLLSPTAEVWDKPPDGVVIWTSPESVSPSYKRLLGGEAADRRLPRVARPGCAVDQTAHVHQGQERDAAALVA